jgi:hypothetical protein
MRLKGSLLIKWPMQLMSIMSGKSTLLVGIFPLNILGIQELPFRHSLLNVSNFSLSGPLKMTVCKGSLRREGGEYQSN